MKKQLVIIGIITILVTIGLSGCDEKNDSNTLNLEKNKFMGTWKHNNNESILNIYSNGTWTSDSTNINLSSGTWDVKDGKFLITYEKKGRTDTYWYTFSNNDKTLEIYDDFVTHTSDILYKQ